MKDLTKNTLMGKRISKVRKLDDIEGVHLIFDDGTDLIIKPNGYETSRLEFFSSQKITKTEIRPIGIREVG